MIIAEKFCETIACYGQHAKEIFHAPCFPPIPTRREALHIGPSVTHRSKLPQERGHFPRRIYQAGDEVFHFYCWSCSNVFGEEIVKLKLDPSYLSMPAES